MYYFKTKDSRSAHQRWCDTMVQKAEGRSTRVLSVKAPVKKAYGVKRYSSEELRAMFETASA